MVMPPVCYIQAPPPLPLLCGPEMNNFVSGIVVVFQALPEWFSITSAESPPAEAKVILI
ncbi:hypothetical protein ACSF6V_11320 [Escherichia coli]|uniref:hypothetical protein n=1 Tax=Escherichia coli TaxID=562 RepID=UPI003EE86332